MAAQFSIRLTPAPIEFGTDGWRGIIAGDFTFERLGQVAPIAAQVLKQTYSAETRDSNLIVVGYDRRFLSPEFAEAVAIAVQQAGFDVMLSNTFVPTPAVSWAVKQYGALGGLVITASHNPAAYSGLKVKGAFGGSVAPHITQEIQAQLGQPMVPAQTSGTLTRFNPWPDYCAILRSKVDLTAIQDAIASGRITVYVDVMHGATATGLEQVLGCPVRELRSAHDPLFGGTAPEPLAKYMPELLQTIRDRAASGKAEGVTVGFVFDGDGDRIAAVDGQGNFLSSQILIPILVEHLAGNRGLTGEFIKTVSGSDLMPKVAQLFNLPVFETPIGYKYIADRMLQTGRVLLGGEESGGIGFGTHIPERDGLLSALYVLEAIAISGKDLSELYQDLQRRTGFSSAYDRIDLTLSSDATKQALIRELKERPFTEILGIAVSEITDPDGFKVRLADGSWVLIRFSGTEPVLRLYCEAATQAEVEARLTWAKEWAIGHES
ncbi:phosphoglucomutase/phosphomannomutase family protein [Altericista sp. CCNU0014]|uniref:phosphoglucomutase/phosphomannomutase family protein n=1 Tax=Altericista sp. CCNU0014 TaxID=3082949 RepID=UPI00384D6643